MLLTENWKLKSSLELRTEQPIETRRLQTNFVQSNNMTKPSRKQFIKHIFRTNLQRIGSEIYREILLTDLQERDSSLSKTRAE